MKKFFKQLFCRHKNHTDIKHISSHYDIWKNKVGDTHWRICHDCGKQFEKFITDDIYSQYIGQYP